VPARTSACFRNPSDVRWPPLMKGQDSKCSAGSFARRAALDGARLRHPPSLDTAAYDWELPAPFPLREPIERRRMSPAMPSPKAAIVAGSGTGLGE